MGRHPELHRLHHVRLPRGGQKRSKIEVVVDEIALHDKKGAAPAGQAAAPEPEAEYTPYDIPF